MLLSRLCIFNAGRDGFVGVLGAASTKSATATGWVMALVLSIAAFSLSITDSAVGGLSAGCLQHSGQNQASGKVLMSTLTHSA